MLVRTRAFMGPPTEREKERTRLAVKNAPPQGIRRQYRPRSATERATLQGGAAALCCSPNSSCERPTSAVAARKPNQLRHVHTITITSGLSPFTCMLTKLHLEAEERRDSAAKERRMPTLMLGQDTQMEGSHLRRSTPNLRQTKYARPKTAGPILQRGGVNRLGSPPPQRQPTRPQSATRPGRLPESQPQLPDHTFSVSIEGEQISCSLFEQTEVQDS